MEPLRIAAHNGAPEFGGAEIATALLLQGLQQRGHEVVLFYNRDVVARGAAAYGLDVRAGRLGGDIAVHHAVRLAGQLRRFRPDALIVGTFRKMWLAALAARLAGVPVVARIGLSTDTPRSAKYRWVLGRWVDSVVTNAADLADAYRAALPGAPPPRIVAVHKGIEPPATTAPVVGTRRGLGIPADALVIGGVGRLVAQKRFDRLLAVAATLPERVHCLLVGDGALRPALEALAAQLGVTRRVHFAGHRDDVMDLMAAMDALVITSDRESLANVMLEAMAVGTPVVSTPVSGAAEALVDGDASAAGMVVEADVVALADALATLLEDDDRRRRMGEAARRRVERHFSRARMLEEWEALLREAAGRNSGRARVGARGEGST